MQTLDHDLVIIGGGAAGLRAAIAAAETSGKLSIALVSKVYPMRSHTVSAEGGTAAVLRDYDSFDMHAFDTIKGSDYLADQDAVDFFVSEAPREIIQLEHWGCPWSREPDGRIAVRAFGGMSVKRTVFAADKTGFHLLHTLYQRSLKHENINRYDEWFATRLLVENGRVHGVTSIDIRTGEFGAFRTQAVIIATGGAGRLYRFTSNGYIKTGDGMSLAYRAGVPLKDMEFIQFHPTLLPGTGILMTEASRGEGGHLLNRQSERFLKRYVPEKMELGPRDILSRASMTEMAEGRGFDGPYGSYVLLDLRHLGEATIDEKLPFVRELTRNYAGIDPVQEPIPVRPGQHYCMGGVHTDSTGQTNIIGLYAVGEAACVSINGANRLGSNSLTECLVFGSAAGKAAAIFARNAHSVKSENPVQELASEEEKRIFDSILKHEGGVESVAGIRMEMQKTMDEHVGIFRSEEGLRGACKVIGELKHRFRQVTVQDKERVYNTQLTSVLELDFMLELSEATAFAALWRKESRGAHSRLDYRERDDQNFLVHSTAFLDEERPRIEQLPVRITRWQPGARKY